MKIVILNGSPRKYGNCTTLLATFRETAEKHGAEITEFRPAEMKKLSGCISCYKCRTKGDRCVLQDDVTAFLEAVPAADLVVFASPVYFSDVSGQFKMAFDRCFSFFNSDYTCRLPAGKKALFILPQGDDDETHYADIGPRYEAFLKWMGFGEVKHFRLLGAQGPDTAKSKPAELARLAKISGELLGTLSRRT